MFENISCYWSHVQWLCNFIKGSESKEILTIIEKELYFVLIKAYVSIQALVPYSKRIFQIIEFPHMTSIVIRIIDCESICQIILRDYKITIR